MKLGKVQSNSLLWILLLNSIGFLGGALPATADAAARALTGPAPAFYTEYVTVAADTAVTVETTNLSAGADPVMHLLQAQTDGTYVQVAYNDNTTQTQPPPDNPLDAAISYTNFGPSKRYLVLVRAKSAGTTGTCRVRLNGSTRPDVVPVGGPLVPVSNWTYSVGDTLRTVHQPGQSVAPALITFPAIPTSVLQVGLGNAVAKTSWVPLSADAAWVLVGTPQVRVETGYYTYRTGTAAVMANDATADPASDLDGDGVGNALEAALGTCWTTTPCGFGAVSGYDTDRDGLSDGEEIWGVKGTLSMGVDDLAFARYGANPRRKDVFLEVDHVYNFGSGVPDGYNPFRWMDTHAIVPGSANTAAWVAKARAPYDLAPAAQVKNPNGENGIAVHFDLGTPPANPADEDKYGSWSTGAARPVVFDFIVQVTAPINGNVTVTINGVSASFDATGGTPGQVAAAIGYLVVFGLQQPVRVKAGGFVDNGTDAKITFETQQAGVNFTRSIAVPAGYEGSIGVLQENDTSLRSAYESEPGQVDSVRIGRMRYAVATGVVGGGQTVGARFVAALEKLNFPHELGHSLGLMHYGHAGWGASTSSDCLPHYQSIMNYGAGSSTFTSESAGVGLNPARTGEQYTFGTQFDHTPYTLKPYEYGPPSGHDGVDWDRDGMLRAVGTRWRTFALDTPASTCSAFSVGRENLYPTDPDVITGAPDLVRHGNRLYAFWSKSTAVLYRFATLGAQGNKSCTGSADPANQQAGACLSWSQTSQAYFYSGGGPFGGVSALSKDGHLYLAINSGSGQIRVARYEADPDGYLSASSDTVLGDTNQPATVTDGSPRHGPELTIRNSELGAGRATLVYLAASGSFQSYTLGYFGWFYDGPLLDPNGAEILGSQAPAAKAWPDNEGAGWAASDRMTLALLPNNDGNLRLFALEYSTNRWRNLQLPEPSIGAFPTIGKPYLEYRMVRDEAGMPTAGLRGSFLIGWMEYSGSASRAAVRVTTACDFATPPMVGGVSQLGLTPLIDKLQNDWADSQADTSAALYSDSTIDNVFGLVPLKTPEITGLAFYPHADASPDTTSTVFSDFMVMEDYVCSTLASYRPPYACGPIDVLH